MPRRNHRHPLEQLGTQSTENQRRRDSGLFLSWRTPPPAQRNAPRMPLQARFEDGAEFRWLTKKVLESRFGAGEDQGYEFIPQLPVTHRRAILVLGLNQRREEILTQVAGLSGAFVPLVPPGPAPRGPSEIGGRAGRGAGGPATRPRRSAQAGLHGEDHQRGAPLVPACLGLRSPGRAAGGVGGYTLPAGTTVVVSQWITYRDRRFFDQPLEFRPERWTEEFEKQLPKFASFPFGGGQRTCIGASFAKMEMTLLVAAMAQKVAASPAPGFKLELLPSITLQPKRGVSVALTREGARGLVAKQSGLETPPPHGKRVEMT